MKYTPTLHAIERARHRLGIEAGEAQRWFNEAMRKSKYLFTQKHAGKTQAVYEIDNVRLIVDTGNHTIITVSPTIDTSILKPVFEREHRKLKREVTRITRRHELAIAQLTVEMGERMVAKANARNPKTRELIQRNIDDIQAKIEKCEALITREQDRLENFVRATGVYA